mgnify:CR=1 FL=1
MADRDAVETLIFDEIDVGISGRTAQKVSEKMAVIGRSHQGTDFNQDSRICFASCFISFAFSSTASVIFTPPRSRASSLIVSFSSRRRIPVGLERGQNVWRTG